MDALDDSYSWRPADITMIGQAWAAGSPEAELALPQTCPRAGCFSAVAAALLLLLSSAAGASKIAWGRIAPAGFLAVHTQGYTLGTILKIQTPTLGISENIIRLRCAWSLRVSLCLWLDHSRSRPGGHS